MESQRRRWFSCVAASAAIPTSSRTPVCTPYQALYGGPYAVATAHTPAAAAAYHAQVSPFHLHLDTTHPHPPAAAVLLLHGPQGVRVRARHQGGAHGEHAFFSDGTEREHHHAAAGHGQWQFKQLGMEPKQSTTPLFPGAGYGNTAVSPYAIDLSKENDDEKERRQQQHCFLLGADLRLENSAGHDHAAATQKPQTSRPLLRRVAA
uniref:Uncharacterized protein n=1 Tax=Oryza sativa subsp. japonica TaxID=39947 RepID=Q8S695_ORYSJ|nr:hypothetical protein [Oryza sativa Japonica Group]